MNKFAHVIYTVSVAVGLTAGEAGKTLETMEEYRALAMPDERMRGLELMEVKFIITGLEGDNPKMHFMNPRESPVHFEFVQKRLRRTRGQTT